MTDIILHHYDASPFSQKVQRMLGLKGLAWRSVETPLIMPKPDLVCLTGGYRGTPVMQIGADVYIDTQDIARELQRRYPEPSLFPARDAGIGNALVTWSNEFFQAGLTIVLAILGPDWDPAFLNDRKAIFTDIDFDHLGDDIEHSMAQMRAHAALLDAQLADGRAFLTGEQPGLADLQAFGVPLFTRAALPIANDLLAPFVHLPAWEARVAALGQGERTEIDAPLAHAEARQAEPDLTARVDADDPQKLKAGMRVRVAADDFSDRGVVEGEVVIATPLEIAVRRRTDDFGDLVVHFPRLGYRVMPLE